MPQNIDIYKGKPIFYSLGNFIFNSFLDEPNAKIGWILEL
jgi:poly-gamma-glutamate capsule biosynthesis protein CapA/YwtB (metallophosphatase superfamily)